MGKGAIPVQISENMESEVYRSKNGSFINTHLVVGYGMLGFFFRHSAVHTERLQPDLERDGVVLRGPAGLRLPGVPRQEPPPVVRAGGRRGPRRLPGRPPQDGQERIQVSWKKSSKMWKIESYIDCVFPTPSRQVYLENFSGRRLTPASLLVHVAIEECQEQQEREEDPQT